MADISAEIAALQAASRGNEVRQTIIDALNKENANTLPAVTASDAGKFLTVNNSGQWEVKSGDLVPRPTGTKTITQNGTHDVTNYADANVNVPNSYASSDEGKVVQNGALVSQTSRSVTVNGTYDTTTNNEVVVNVSGGGGGGSAIALIFAVYNQGDTITATDGTTTLTSDTSGQYTFEIASAGVWTFTSSQYSVTQQITVVKGTVREIGLFESFLPNTDPLNILCETLAQNFDPNLSTWDNIQYAGGGTPLYDSTESAVYFNALTPDASNKKVYGYYDLGANGTPFTAYTVVKTLSGTTNYRRLMSAVANKDGDGGVLAFGKNNIHISSWANDTATGISDNGLFVVLALCYSLVPNQSGGIVANSNSISNFITKSPKTCGRYITLGRTDIESNNDRQEPSDILVKYFAVVDHAEDQSDIIANVTALKDRFLNQ